MEKKLENTTPSKSHSTSSNLPIIELKDNIKVVVSQKAYAKISYLIQRISEVEWSALMFYTAKGHYTNPKEMICKVEDVYLMDKGTSGSTSHNYDNEDVIKAFDKHPEYMDMKIGHLHSHSTFSVFFSGTDMDELTDNVINHQYYLSLVVNNKGEMVAKLVYSGKQEVSRKITIKNKLGNWIKWSSAKSAEEDVMFSHNCDISISIPDAIEFVERFKEVTTKVKTVPVVKGFLPSGKPTYSYGRGSFYEEEDNFTEYYGNYSKPPVTKTNIKPNYEKQTLFAKALVSCRISDIEDKSIYEVIREAKDTFKGVDSGAMADSYSAFYATNCEAGGNNFILEAYANIYNRKIADVTIGEIEIEAEAAVKLIYGEIGNAITEAVDDYILSVYEREDKVTEEPLKELLDGK